MNFDELVTWGEGVRTRTAQTVRECRSIQEQSDEIALALREFV